MEQRGAAIIQPEAPSDHAPSGIGQAQKERSADWLDQGGGGRSWSCWASADRGAAGRAHRERSADWLDQAQGALAHARNDVEARFFGWACFSSQQAAETAVKAVVPKLGRESWGSSVADRLATLAASRAVDRSLVDATLERDNVYLPARSPRRPPLRLTTRAPRVVSRRRKAWWPLPRAAFGSVKLVSPADDRATRRGLLRARLPALAAVLPLARWPWIARPPEPTAGRAIDLKED